MAKDAPGADRRFRGKGHALRLAEELNLARLARGMSQREVAVALAGVPGCSLASVNRALAGKTLVSGPATLAIGEAVGAPPERVRALWEKAAANRTPVYRTQPSTDDRRAPARAHAADRPLHLITQPHELTEAVRLLRARRGQPTYRAMETAARRAGYSLGRSACQARSQWRLPSGTAMGRKMRKLSAEGRTHRHVAVALRGGRGSRARSPPAGARSARCGGRPSGWPRTWLAGGHGETLLAT
ncbi:helix-turn-helix domain-containing protein [Kitasatospora sp. NPDC001159]